MSSKQIKLLLLIMGCIAIVSIGGVLFGAIARMIIDNPDTMLFEDGSFKITGCLPFHLCTL